MMNDDSKWNELINRLYAREVLIREMADAMEYYASRGGGRCREILSRPVVKAIIAAGGAGKGAKSMGIFFVREVRGKYAAEKI